MTRATKVVAVLIGLALVLVLGTGMLVAGTAVTSGLMTLSIQEEGPDGLNLYVPVPAGLIEGALALTPVVLRLIDDQHGYGELERVRAELDELLPALEVMLDELPRMPDAVLVEVDGAGEYVRVSKEGRSLRVLVEEDGSRIAVTVPLSVFRSLGGFLRG